MSRLYRGRKLLQKNLMSYAVEQGVLQAPRAMELGSEAEEEADVVGGAPGGRQGCRARGRARARLLALAPASHRCRPRRPIGGAPDAQPVP